MSTFVRGPVARAVGTNKASDLADAALRTIDREIVFSDPSAARGLFLEAVSEQLLHRADTVDGASLIEIAVDFERWYGHRPVVSESGVVRLSRSHQRKTNGVYFTPPALARALAERTLGPLLDDCQTAEEILRLRVIDPACGAGAFVLAAIHVLQVRLRKVDRKAADDLDVQRQLISTCVVGVDVEPVIAGFARSLLARSIEVTSDASSLANVIVGDGLSEAPEWLLQKEAWDVVLMNPPWGAIRVDNARFARSNGVSGCCPLAIREFDQHRGRIRSLGRRLRRSHSDDSAALVDRGDLDWYKLFMERALALSGTPGRIGLVVPASFTRTAGAAALRELYFSQGSVEHLCEFVNRKRIFPIHGMFRFLGIVYERTGEPGGIRRASYRVETPDAMKVRPTSSRWAITPAEMATICARTGIPTLRTAPEKKLYLRLLRDFEAAGIVIDGRSPKFVRELDMTNDRFRFDRSDEVGEVAPNLLPVYEGRMIGQFDSNRKSYCSGTGRSARWEMTAGSSSEVRPQYYVDSSKLPTRIGDRVWHPRAAFCDVTGHANERTILASIIPGGSACGNKVPTLDFGSGSDLRHHLLWSAIANSFVIDWLLRRWIDTTVNFFYWRQFPAPAFSLNGHQEQRLVELAAELHGATVDPSRVIDGSQIDPLAASVSPACRIRSQMDAIVADLFGLSSAELRLILADFPLLDREQPSGQKGAQGVTVLSVLDAAGALTGDEPARLADLRTAGDKAFISGELARQRLV